MRWATLFICASLMCLNTIAASSALVKNNSQIASNQRQVDQILAAERQRVEARNRLEREADERRLIALENPAQTPSDSLWKGFRTSFPYHIQVLALSEPHAADQSRTLIVSEPPPHVTLGQILSCVGNLLINHQVKQLPVGYGGWVRDVVISLKGNRQEIASILSRLNQRLFFTSYKSYALPLPLKLDRLTDNLDLKVTAAEVKHWTVDVNQNFIPIEGGDSLPLAKLFAQPGCGVYRSLQRGLIGWWIPDGYTLNDCRVQARQFTLDSDLIVGALANSKGMLVLGRERVAPVELLPPLRVETLELLANVQRGQAGALAQSYERTRPFAGVVAPIPRNELGVRWTSADWAPIYLSPVLRDTEYGSLLNIADQLLKGWSNDGETQYFNFDYPKPGPWPPSVLARSLLEGNLTYNWNTRGAGYTVSYKDYEALALNRTGALPISYIPDGIAGDSKLYPQILAELSEDRAYEYFARISDLNLVRVVQYAVAYQIFSAFNIARSAQPVRRSDFEDRELERLMNELLMEIRRATEEQTNALVNEILSSKYFQRDIQSHLSESRIVYERGLLAEGLKPSSKDYEDKLRVKLDKRREALNESFFKMIKGELELAKLDKAKIPPFSAALSVFAGLRNLPERYTATASAKTDGWIHTPVVVLSTNLGRMTGMIGGHNLNAKVTKFKVSNQVGRNKADYDPDGNVYVNPLDVGKVRRVLRSLERDNFDNRVTAREIAERLRAELPMINDALLRTMRAAMNLPPSPPNPPRSAAVAGAVDNFGWGRAQLPSAKQIKMTSDLIDGRQTIPDLQIVERNPDGSFLIKHHPRSQPLSATSLEDAVDILIALRQRNPLTSRSVSLELRGMQQQEGYAFMQSYKSRAVDGKIPGEISGIFNNSPKEASMIKLIGKQRFDYSKAKVGQPKIERLGTGQFEGTIEIEAPSLNGSDTVGRIGVRLRFAERAPRGAVNSFFQRLVEFIETLLRDAKYRLNSMRFNFRLNQEIKRISRETGVDVEVIRHQFNSSYGDLFFVRTEEKDGNRAPDNATGPSE